MPISTGNTDVPAPTDRLSVLTIYYTETFRLFPENWGDIQTKIG
jgi:hypothetical protein